MNVFRSHLKYLRFLPALLLSVSVRVPLAHAADDEPAAANTDHAEERKILEMDLARFYALIQQDNDPSTKTTLLGYQREYASRANKLLENFDASKYDDLRYDINLQCQRVSRKMAPLITPPLEVRLEAANEIAVYELEPSPADKNDVKAALDSLDVTIKKMDNRLARMTIGSNDYQTEKARVQRVKDQRAQLGKAFTKAG